MIPVKGHSIIKPLLIMMFPYENNDYNNSPTMNIIIISPVMYIYIVIPPKK